MTSNFPHAHTTFASFHLPSFHKFLTIPQKQQTMSHTNIEDEETFAPIYATQEDFNPNDTVSSFLNTAYDPARLHPLAGLGGTGGLDYISLEDDAGSLPGAHRGGGILPSRGWSDDLTYGTGLTYITGACSSLFFRHALSSNLLFLVATNCPFPLFPSL